MTIERSRRASLGDGRSGLELQFERLVAAAGLPPAVREYHFAWCCEHPKTAHTTHPNIPPSAFYLNRTTYQRCEDCRGTAVQWVHDYRHDRNWRLDFAWPWPERKLAVEIEGGVYSGGRHTRGKGFEADAEKSNAAVLAGWRVFRFTADHLDSGYALETLEAAFA